MSPRLAACPPLLLLAAVALAGPPSPAERGGHHEIRLRLEPGSSELRGSDRYTAPYESKLRFTLREPMQLDALRCGEQDLLPQLRPDRKATDAGGWELRVPRSCAGSEGELVLDFDFHGEIGAEKVEAASPPSASEAREASGLSRTGALLLPGGFFHPDFGTPAAFDLVLDVPSDWSVASAGRIAKGGEPPEKGRALFTFVSDQPSDGLALSAGPYAVLERKHGKTLLRSLFFAGNEQAAELFLEAASSSLDRIEERLGPYPHEKLELVESGVATGEAFHGFALLGSERIARGPGGAGADGLAPLLLQAYWGAGVLESEQGGGWSEGLRAEVASAIAIEDEGEEAAAVLRRGVAQALAIAELEERAAASLEAEGPSASSSPGRRSRSGSGTRSGGRAGGERIEGGDQVGVGEARAALIFHQLRRELGDELFWAGLRELASRRLGERSSWADVRSIFEELSKRELERLFSQWLERPGLPRLALAQVAETKGRVTGVITQEGEAYELRPEIRIRLQDGREESARVAIASGSTPFSIEVGGPVATVELDPDWHLPRRIEPSELPQCLSLTLAAKARGHALLVAHPIAPFEAPVALQLRAEAYKQLAETIAQRHGGQALPALAVAAAEWNSSSLVLLGGPDENPLVARMLEVLLDAGFDPTGRGFRAGTRRWSEDGDSLLASLAHPDRAGASVSVWIPSGDGAVAAGLQLLDSPWDGWVAFRDGRATERGTVWPETSSWRVELAPPAAPATPAARLRDRVMRLVRPELEGRDAASNAARRTAEDVGAAMEDARLQPWDPRGFQQVFFWFLRDLPRPAKFFRELPDRSNQSYDCAPAAYWLPVPPNLMATGGNVELDDSAVVEPILIPLPEGLVHAGSIEKPAFRGLDLRGAAAVLIDETPLPSSDEPEARAAYERERSGRYMDLLSEVRRQEGETLVIVRPQDEPPFFPALASYASLDAQSDPSLAAAARAGGERGLARAVSARHAGAPRAGAPVRLVFAGAQLLEAMRAEGPLRPGRRWWQGLYLDLRMRIDTQRVFDRNLIGMTLGMRRLSEGVVLVGAHHDGIGLSPDGRVRPGAVKNAAGTAVLLELGRRLAADPAPLTVAFVSFGASEWGLVGSRSLAEAWPTHWPVRALINLDSLGERGAGLEVIGREREPALAERLLSAAAAREIDLRVSLDPELEHASSDHWPWIEKGVPAVSITQSGEEGLDESGGRVEDLDFEALARLVDALEASIRQLASGTGP